MVKDIKDEIKDELRKIGFELIAEENNNESILQNQQFAFGKSNDNIAITIVLSENTYGNGYSLDATYNMNNDYENTLAEISLDIAVLDNVSNKLETITNLENDLNNMVDIVMEVENYLKEKYKNSIFFFEPFSTIS